MSRHAWRPDDTPERQASDERAETGDGSQPDPRHWQPDEPTGVGYHGPGYQADHVASQHQRTGYPAGPTELFEPTQVFTGPNSFDQTGPFGVGPVDPTQVEPYPPSQPPISWAPEHPDPRYEAASPLAAPYQEDHDWAPDELPSGGFHPSGGPVADQSDADDWAGPHPWLDADQAEVDPDGVADAGGAESGGLAEAAARPSRRRSAAAPDKPSGRRSGRRANSQPSPGSGPDNRSEPEPVEVNDIRIVLIGTLAWLAAFATLWPFRATMQAHGHGMWLWTCLAGAGLGLIGLYYVHRRREALHRAGHPTDQSDDGAAAQPAPADDADAGPDREPAHPDHANAADEPPGQPRLAHQPGGQDDYLWSADADQGGPVEQATAAGYDYAGEPQPFYPGPQDGGAGVRHADHEPGRRAAGPAYGSPWADEPDDWPGQRR